MSNCIKNKGRLCIIRTLSVKIAEKHPLRYKNCYKNYIQYKHKIQFFKNIFIILSRKKSIGFNESIHLLR